MACNCSFVGRIDSAIRYSEAGQRLIGDERFDKFPFDHEASLGSPYIPVGQPERWAEVARRQLEHTDDRHGNTRAVLAIALALSGASDEAITLTDGLIETAEASHNPFSLSQVLLAVGLAHRNGDLATALGALKRALEVARDSGNRFYESHISVVLSDLEARHGSPEAAFDHLTLAIRNYLETGNIATSRSPLAILAGLLCQLGHYEPAATIADFAANPLTRMAFPEITATIDHLREVLGDDHYDSLGRTGQAMTNSAMANYAFEQIELARAQLSHPTTPT